MLRQIGIRFDVPTQASITDGFTVFPEDGSDPIRLPYADGSHGIACEHEYLVSRLHEAMANEPSIDLIPERVRAVADRRVTLARDGVEASVTADLIVGADGRRSVVRRSLGLATKPKTCSRMLGFLLQGVTLPVEGYGSLVSGAPGPMFIYRLGEDSVRINVDVPLRFPPSHTTDLLLNSYAPVLPEDMRPKFEEMVRDRRYQSTANTLSPRVSYGRPGRVLVGDAAGHYHPMTAVGLTLGFSDAIALAESEDHRRYLARRMRGVRAPEMLALAFYELVVDHRAEAAALRRSVYRMWRRNGGRARQSMRLLSCEDTSEYSLGLVGATTVMQAALGTIPRSLRPRDWRRAGGILSSLAVRIAWFVRGVWHLRAARGDHETAKKRFLDAMARALPASMPSPRRSGPSPD